MKENAAQQEKIKSLESQLQTKKETVVSGWSSEQRSEDTLHHRDQEPLSKSDLVAALPGEDDSEL